MSKMKRRYNKVKKMKKGECRVIRIDSGAILEFVQENIMERCNEFFNVPLAPRYKGLFYWTMDEETGDIIIFYSEDWHLDFDKVIGMVPLPTTDTMYKPNRYVSLFFDENTRMRSDKEK
jgi:hypothetical protein